MSVLSNGHGPDGDRYPMDDEKVVQYINVKLAALGHPIFGNMDDSKFLNIAQPLILNHREKNRLLLNYLPPVDKRIQSFLDDYLSELPSKPTIKLPANTFILDRPGLARTLSLPPDQDEFHSEIVDSYRVYQGILNNPKSDRRTTKGVFHVAEGGLPIPDDKKAVPKHVFASILHESFRPPRAHLRLPFTSSQKEEAHLFVSLLLRPVVVQEVPEYTPEKSMEIRFFAPGSLVSNLDFVEHIFGNGGDPYLPEHDAGLDVDHWTGHTGCVILAPHLIGLRKKDIGLPHVDQATDRQKRDGMCWRSEDERYNEGEAFKLTCRDARGVMVTIIADNYFGYCKKEVKTQISFAANLYGQSEEEHSGGAIAFPSYVLGQDFSLERWLSPGDRRFADIAAILGERIEIKPEGYGVDRNYSNIVYVPEDAHFHVREQSVTWRQKGVERSIPLLRDHTYVLPTGYRVFIEKQLGGPTWRLVGVTGEGTLCHKPSTVSGGGKSEISKSIAYAMIQGPVFVPDFPKDFERVEAILKRDYGNTYKDPERNTRANRPILSADRSLGSVIKLFTPSDEYTDAHNDFIRGIPNTLKQLLFVIKRYYREQWGDNLRAHFSVDRVNGVLGHELKFNNVKLVANYLRIGHDADGSWRIFKLRPDYHAAEKVQVEDDITVSVVLPRDAFNNLDPAAYPHESLKLVKNCERMLFQRPDDCVHRGYDKQAEADLATPGTFLSNFEPLTRDDARRFIDRTIEFDQYSRPIKRLISNFYHAPRPAFFVSSAHSRVVDGAPSKNPRYLQRRPDLVNHRDTYLAETSTRLSRAVPSDRPVHMPVNAVLAGRRNNPPDKKRGIPALAVFNPIHFQELPELFMDFICSLTGKSPSTTGFGSEGALTKGPFNALWPVVDLNTALVSYILTGYAGFTTAAGYVGPKYEVGHDISLLVPEIWCRMKPPERDPKSLIERGYLEKVEDFAYNGRTILASRLGYRITQRFVDRYLGRVFEAPDTVFNEEMLKPELQSLEVYVDGIDNVVEGMKRVAENYFADGSVEAACPPLKALLHIMAKGTFEGKDIHHPEIRSMFTRDSVMKSDWYQERIHTKQLRDINMWKRHVDYLERFCREESHQETAALLGIADRLDRARRRLAFIESDAYRRRLQGTLGADPFRLQITASERAQLAGAAL